MNNAANENDAANNKINNNKTTSRSFEYKTMIIGSASANINRLSAEVAVPLKYLNNFWRSLNLPLINCEIELDLSWSKNCVISEILKTPEVVGDNPVEATLITGATFQTKSAKFYVPVVTLSIDDNIKFLENIKQGFKRTVP